VKKRNSWFLRCEGWKGLQISQMNTMKFLVHESFEFEGFCTWPRLAVHQDIGSGLGGEFCEKMKFVVFEM